MVRPGNEEEQWGATFSISDMGTKKRVMNGFTTRYGVYAQNTGKLLSHQSWSLGVYSLLLA